MRAEVEALVAALYERARELGSEATHLGMRAVTASAGIDAETMMRARLREVQAMTMHEVAFLIDVHVLGHHSKPPGDGG